MGHKFGYWTPCGLLDIGYWRLDMGYGLLGNGGVCDTMVVDFDEFLFEDNTNIL